jgi:hypothetical protein
VYWSWWGSPHNYKFTTRHTDKSVQYEYAQRWNILPFYTPSGRPASLLRTTFELYSSLLSSDVEVVSSTLGEHIVDPNYKSRCTISGEGRARIYPSSLWDIGNGIGTRYCARPLREQRMLTPLARYPGVMLPTGFVALTKSSNFSLEGEGSPNNRPNPSTAHPTPPGFSWFFKVFGKL